MCEFYRFEHSQCHDIILFNVVLWSKIICVTSISLKTVNFMILFRLMGLCGVKFHDIISFNSAVCSKISKFILAQ